MFMQSVSQLISTTLTYTRMTQSKLAKNMSYQTLFTVFACLSITLSFLLFFKNQKRKAADARRVPPGPRKLPFIGNLHQLGELPHKSLQHLSQEHGPLMLLQLGAIHTLVVSSADMAREIYRSHDLAFSGRPVLYAGNKFSYSLSAVSLVPYGEYWREMRKILVSELLGSKKVQTFEGIRAEEVAFMVNSIVRCSVSKIPVNISKLVFRLSNNVVSRVAFGGIYEENREFHRIIHEIQELMGEVNIADFYPWMAWFNKFNGVDSRINKNFREVDGFFCKVIEEHLDPKRANNTGIQEDIVDVLLRIQRDPSQTLRFSDENVKGVLMDILVAGSDTSSATLEWTMAELTKNPEVKKRAQEEVREAFPQKGMVEETDLPNLKYLKLVIKESLRMHPPAPLLVPRETLESCVVGGYTIPAQTRVFINAASISRDPKCWENPDEFKPERFLDNSVDFRGQNFELLPFGAGRRICPGIHFAVPLVELALANLLLRFDWGLPEGIVAEDLDMEEAMGITVHKKTPLWLAAASSYHVAAPVNY